MARTNTPAPVVDPDVIAAERRRDRVASQHDDGTATIEALEAAEGRLSNAIANADRRAERAAAVAREREREATEEADRAARWRAASPAVSENLIARENAADAIEQACADLVEAVRAWQAVPPLSPLLVDAPPVIASRKDVHPLASAFTEAMRPVANALGLGFTPLPPPAFRAPITEIIEQVHAPVREALDVPKAKR